MKGPLSGVLAGLLLSGAAPCMGAEVDIVHGDLIRFNDNGAWCWFQGPRVVFDPATGTLLIASVADDWGEGGAEREGDVEVTAFDMASGGLSRFTLHDRLISYNTGDDHNTPALWIRPDGRYLAMYAGHNNDNLSRYRVTTQPGDATEWGPERHFDWAAANPAGVDFPTSYSNLIYLPAERRLYNFARGDNRSPNVMVSDDDGETWRYGGKLTRTPAGVGYVNGYPKYASNGSDTIHFIITEHHPRDFNNGVYHGFIRGGRTHGSDGAVVDESIFDEQAPTPTGFTPVIRGGQTIDGVRLTRAWTTDLVVDGRGLPHALLTARADDDDTDHRFVHARFDGASWIVHHLAAAGPGLYQREEDYVGLGAIDPADPDVLYLSTPVDQRDGVKTDHHEIYRGETEDGGETWRWDAVTEQSTADNLRPIVVNLPAGGSALLWYRGRYQWQHQYDTSIVGVIRGK